MTARRIIELAVVAALIVFSSAASEAQSLEVRGFFDVGVTTFTAKDTFNAVLGSADGVVFGGGAGVVLPMRVFVNVHASRFQKDRHRVFVSGSDVFDLGITDTVTITPVDVTAGYRFGRAPAHVIPYVGGGFSWYRYQETDPFAQPGEAADESFTGYHVLGGADVPIMKWLGVAGEVQWTTVPNALGVYASSAGGAFGDTDLGGTTVRVKVVVGR